MISKRIHVGKDCEMCSAPMRDVDLLRRFCPDCVRKRATLSQKRERSIGREPFKVCTDCGSVYRPHCSIQKRCRGCAEEHLKLDKERYFAIRNLRSLFARMCIENKEEAEKVISDMAAEEGPEFVTFAVDGIYDRLTKDPGSYYGKPSRRGPLKGRRCKGRRRESSRHGRIYSDEEIEARYGSGGKVSSDGRLSRRVRKGLSRGVRKGRIGRMGRKRKNFGPLFRLLDEASSRGDGSEHWEEGK